MEKSLPVDDPMFKRIIKGKENSTLASLIHLMKELPAIEAVLGTHYEVKNKEGEVIYTITKRGLDFEQINILLEELEEYDKIQEKQMKKGKGLNKSKTR